MSKYIDSIHSIAMMYQIYKSEFLVRKQDFVIFFNLIFPLDELKKRLQIFVINICKGSL
jgi:hypothetical protein